MRCKVKLITFKEKVSRTCTSCALSALDGFDKMATGNIKEGFNQVLKGKSEEQKAATAAVVKNVLSKKEKRLTKALKRKGLSEEEIEEGLKRFRGLGV